MKTITWLVLIAACSLFLRSAAAQGSGLGTFEIIIRPEAAKALLPLNDEAARRYLETRPKLYNQPLSVTNELDRPYGFDQEDPYHSETEPDLNIVFRRVHPFPQMRFVRPQPEPSPLVGPTTGVVAVEAWTTQWPVSPPHWQGSPGTRTTVWRWDVPRKWQQEWPYFSSFVYRDRYAVLGLVMRRWIDGKETASRYDPAIFCFDALTALRWQADVPVRAAVQEYAARTGATADLTSRNAGGATVLMAVSQDGSRVWVAAFWARPRISILFVYDREGSVLRTVVLPDRLAIGKLQRCPTQNRFLVTFEWSAPVDVKERMGYASPIDESYLVSADGDLLGRLVDADGLPVAAERVSDTYAVGAQLQKSGEYRKILYRLP